MSDLTKHRTIFDEMTPSERLQSLRAIDPTCGAWAASRIEELEGALRAFIDMHELPGRLGSFARAQEASKLFSAAIDRARELLK